MRFLSPEWIDALDRAASAAPPPLSDATLVVQQTVVDADETSPSGATWHVVMDPSGVRVRAGSAPAVPGSPVVRFTTDRATAVAVLHGELAAQAAFMRGDLRVGGDTAALVDHADSLAALDDLFAAVRADTEV